MNQEDEVMENGKSRKRRQLTPEEQAAHCLSPETLNRATRLFLKNGCLVLMRSASRHTAHAAHVAGPGGGGAWPALAAFASSKPGRPASAEQAELDLLRADNDRLSEALKELAVELTLHRGRQRSGFSARSRSA